MKSNKLKATIIVGFAVAIAGVVPAAQAAVELGGASATSAHMTKAGTHLSARRSSAQLARMRLEIAEARVAVAHEEHPGSSLAGAKALAGQQQGLSRADVEALSRRFH